MNKKLLFTLALLPISTSLRGAQTERYSPQDLAEIARIEMELQQAVTPDNPLNVPNGSHLTAQVKTIFPKSIDRGKRVGGKDLRVWDIRSKVAKEDAFSATRYPDIKKRAQACSLEALRRKKEEDELKVSKYKSKDPYYDTIKHYCTHCGIQCKTIGLRFNHEKICDKK